VDDIRLVTFDCYGTLIDWEGGLGSFLYQLAQNQDEPELCSGAELRERWEELQFELIRGEYVHYRDVLSDSLREWVAERGYRWNERDGAALCRAMESWQPFPDTVPALRRVREAGVALAIVSNTDRSIMEHTLRQLAGIEFDHVCVAEDCRAYKPSTTPFLHALSEVGVDRENVLHVAFGFEYDIDPAQEVGLHTAWVNRKGEERPRPTAPDYEWRDLWGLAELVA
jgi:2-haloalkanoic acid dehalogenase type II